MGTIITIPRFGNKNDAITLYELSVVKVLFYTISMFWIDEVILFREHDPDSKAYLFLIDGFRRHGSVKQNSVVFYIRGSYLWLGRKDIIGGHVS